MLPFYNLRLLAPQLYDTAIADPMTALAWALLAVALACSAADGAESAAQSPRADWALENSGPQRRAAALADQLAAGALLHAALMAGGERDQADVPRISQRFERFLSSLSASNLPEEARPRAAAIFQRLHAELLTGKYQATCSDVAVTLDRGDFNCLTGTILFVCAARYCGLEVRAQAAQGHVLCQVFAAEGDFSVETTCPRWFALSQAEAAAAIERAASPTDSRGARREFRLLTDRQLLAKIHYNRGVACLRAGDFEQGLRLTRTSLALDPQDQIARGNVLAGLNNWALTLCERGEYSRAAELFRQLQQLDPAYPTLKENQAHLHRAWATQRLECGQ